jgi:hypothetical protein
LILTARLLRSGLEALSRSQVGHVDRLLVMEDHPLGEGDVLGVVVGAPVAGDEHDGSHGEDDAWIMWRLGMRPPLGGNEG